MIVTAVRVRDFKSITDSNEVRIDEDVTCLVGKNESGKTAFLEALYKAKPLPTGHPKTFIPLRDFPRDRYALEREKAAGVFPIEVTLELVESDIAWLENEFGKGCIGAPKVVLSRNYANEDSIYFKISEPAVIKKLLRDAGVDRSLAEDSESVSAMCEKLRALPDPPPAVGQVLSQIQENDPIDELRDAVAGLCPSIHYFDEYSVMPGRVSIPRLQEHEDDLDSRERTALALLRLAAVETADFSEDEYEARKAALEAASSQLTKEVFEFWSQNKELLVELDLDFKSPPGEHGEQPPFLEIRIKNLRHGVSLNFGERSAGFVWFFSFLAAFSEYRDSEEQLLLLLDEPGLGLHASAQGDLLRYIDERLAPSHQVIYTTHSPFMVEPTRLDRVRTVEDVDGKGTTIGEDVLATTSETRFPLQAALGYELAQTLFVGPDNLVVEGPADYLYLSILSEHLRAAGRTSLDGRWTIVPVGGLDKIPTFIALLGAQLNVGVVVDGKAGGSQKISSLISAGIIDAKRVLALSAITGTKVADIEDLFEEDFYLRLLKGAGITGVTKTKLGPGDRIVKRVEAIIGDYDHYRPARYLLEKQVTLLPTTESTTLDHFEKLFKEVNAWL